MTQIRRMVYRMLFLGRKMCPFFVY